MSSPRDPDVILATWLDEQAIPLPPETHRAIEVGIRSIPQRRQPSWPLRRLTLMPNPLRLAAMAIVVVVVASGAYLFLRPISQSSMGGGPASPSPAPSASARIDPSSWVPYTSTTYGFSLRHQPDWSPFDETNRVFFSGGASWGTGISVGRYVNADGLEPQAWMDANCDRTNAFTANRPDDSKGAVPCGKPLDNWTNTSIDGHEAFQSDSPDNCCLDVVAFVDDKVYLVTGWHNATELTLFNAFLSTITLQP
jgi:hypothetical protein